MTQDPFEAVYKFSSMIHRFGLVEALGLVDGLLVRLSPYHHQDLPRSSASVADIVIDYGWGEPLNLAIMALLEARSDPRRDR